jgi:hypothetical protein
MNEQTAALMGQLAVKLGTTSEYLWTVLLKQAPIQGWIMVFEYALTAVALAVLWRFRAALSAGIKNCMDGDADVVVFIGLVIAGLAALFWLLACMFAFESMLTAFLNPEYWALNKVLATVKSK